MTDTEAKLREMLRAGTTPEAISRKLGPMGTFYLRQLQGKRIVETVDGVTRLCQYRADPAVVAAYQRRKQEEQEAAATRAVVEAEATRPREEKRAQALIDEEKRRQASEARLAQEAILARYGARLAACETAEARADLVWRLGQPSRVEAMAAKALAKWRPMGSDELQKVGRVFGIEMDIAA